MKSTWLLLKTQRQGLLVVSLLAMLLTFLVGIEDLRLRDPKSYKDTLVLSFVFAPLLILPLKIHTRLASLPFPVTSRQIAWIPAIAVAAIWLAGLVGALAAIVCHSLYGNGPLWALVVYCEKAAIHLPVFAFVVLVRTQVAAVPGAALLFVRVSLLLDNDIGRGQFASGNRKILCVVVARSGSR